MKTTRFATILWGCLLWSLPGFGFELTPQLGHNTWVETVAFSPDGKYLASGAGDKLLKL